MKMSKISAIQIIACIVMSYIFLSQGNFIQTAIFYSNSIYIDIFTECAIIFVPTIFFVIASIIDLRSNIAIYNKFNKILRVTLLLSLVFFVCLLIISKITNMHNNIDKINDITVTLSTIFGIISFLSIIFISYDYSNQLNSNISKIAQYGFVAYNVLIIIDMLTNRNYFLQPIIESLRLTIPLIYVIAIVFGNGFKDKNKLWGSTMYGLCLLSIFAGAYYQVKFQPEIHAIPNWSIMLSIFFMTLAMDSPFQNRELTIISSDTAV